MNAVALKSGESEDVYKIRIHHIGGIGNYGYVENLSLLGDVQWVVYDALEESLSATKSPGAEFKLVPRCIGGADASNVAFFVTKAPSASSLFRQATGALEYTLVLPDGRLQVWGPHSKAEKTISLDLSALQTLINSGEVPAIDFLSVDAQGAELDILKGAMPALGTGTLGVLCEVEFTELYEGQPVFSQTDGFLRGQGFRLCEIYNKQYMNTTPLPPQIEGRGFLTVGEALFLRNVPIQPQDNLGVGQGALESADEVVQLVKLAAIAVAFDQLDYAIKICTALERDRGVSLVELSKVTTAKYVGLLRDLMAAATIVQKTKPALLERDEGEPGGSVSRASMASGLIAVLLKTTIQGTLRGIATRVSGKESLLGLTATSRVLYRYGLREVAIRQMLRDANIPYWTKGEGRELMDYFVSILVKLT